MLMLALSSNLDEHSYMSFEEQPDYLAIHEGFSATEFGQALGTSVRYEKFKPVGVSNQRWIELLGPDVDNLAHLVSTYELTQDFISSTETQQPTELSPKDKAILKVAAITHDWAEAVPAIGDTSYSDKTEHHEKLEREAFAEHLDNFYPDATPEVAELISDATREVTFNCESRLGRIFNAVERIGYLKTAMRASEHLAEGTAPGCADGLCWLVADIVSNHHTSHLIAAGGRFIAAHDFLEINQDQLESVFDVSRVAALTSFKKFDPGRAQAKEASCNTAEQLWDSWCGEFIDEEE